MIQGKNMHGINKNIVCITGTNKCAIDALIYSIKNKNKAYDLVALIDKSDKGKDNWQPSFKKFVKKKKIKILKLEDLYKIKKLFLFSFEYRNILNVNLFKSKNLFNIHFSLLPKYRGCHTNYLQLRNGEKTSGVTLHKIDSGIDSGPIVDYIKFRIKQNTTAYENYNILIKFSKKIFIKNFRSILKGKYNLINQNLKNATYYSRNSVVYSKLVNIKLKKHTLTNHNFIRALIFPPFQLPIVNGITVKKSIFKKRKIILLKK